MKTKPKIKEILVSQIGESVFEASGYNIKIEKDKITLKPSNLLDKSWILENCKEQSIKSTGDDIIVQLGDKKIILNYSEVYDLLILLRLNYIYLEPSEIKINEIKEL